MRQIIKNGTIVTGSEVFLQISSLMGKRSRLQVQLKRLKNWHSREIRRSMYLDA